VDVRRKLLRRGESLPPNLEISTNTDIEEDFKRAGHLIYRGSSSVIYGVLAGLKPFYVSKPEEIDSDPLYELQSWRERVESVEELIQRFHADQKRSIADLTEEWSRARGYCASYVQPVQESAIDEMLEYTNSCAKMAIGGHTMPDICEENALRFTEILRKRLGENLHAVVLYGSVARGTAHAGSDVDLLVVTDAESAFDLVGEAAYEVDFATQFRTFLTPIEFSREQLEHCLSAGDPFAERVLEEGKVLYDDGTLKELHDRIVAARA
jgi:predicted nucleotidyltransferase